MPDRIAKGGAGGARVLRAFTRIYAALTALYTCPPQNGHSNDKGVPTMKLYPIRAAAAFAACLLALPAVHAQEGPTDAPPAVDGAGQQRVDERGPGFGPPPGGLPFLRGLDLSEAQQDQVFAILHAEVPRRRELDKAERRAHDALRALAGKAPLDEAKAAAAAQALGQAVADLELLRLRTGAQVLAVLTPQQRAQLDERRAQRDKVRGQAHGRRADKARATGKGDGK